MTVNLYQSDVRTMSDEELERLSTELLEAYTISCSEEEHWTDDAAEERYGQMLREMRLRYDAKHPEEAARRGRIAKELTPILATMMREELNRSAEFRQFLQSGTVAIGNTIEVRRPSTFIQENGNAPR